MDFRGMEETYRQLRAEMDDGRIGWDDFARKVNSMRIQDSAGTWWQIDPGTGRWLAWDGTAWRPSSWPPTYGYHSKEAEKSYAFPGFKDEKTSPLKKRSSKKCNVASYTGSILAAGLWFVYSSLYSIRFLISHHEWPRGDTPDFITPLIIIAMPALFNVFRKPIDKLLIPFRMVLKFVPRFILVGIALAVPMVIAYQLYDYTPPGWSTGLTQYTYLRVCVILGGFCSYAILRAPKAR